MVGASRNVATSQGPEATLPACNYFRSYCLEGTYLAGETSGSTRQLLGRGLGVETTQKVAARNLSVCVRGYRDTEASRLKSAVISYLFLEPP